MKPFVRHLVPATLLLLASAAGLSAQERGMGMMADLIVQDPLEAALEHGEALGLGDALMEEIRSAHAASVERTEEERANLAPMLERMQTAARMRSERQGARQGQAQRGQGQGMGMGQGAGMMMQNREGRMAGAAGEMREAMDTLQTEFRASLEWLGERLSEEQVDAIEEAVRLPGPGR